MQRREFILGSAALSITSVIGSVAYTNANVKRDVSINVTTDDQALIGLSPGTTNAVTLVDGKLAFDATTANAAGLNANATFTYGDSASPTTDYAFTLTNNDGESHSFTISLLNLVAGPNADLTFHLYKTDGTSIGEVTESTSQTVTIASAETIYVHLSVTTDGLTSADTITGTLDISAQ